MTDGPACRIDRIAEGSSSRRGFLARTAALGAAVAAGPPLARAEALGVPVYIHPASPAPEIKRLYYDGLGDAWVSRILAGPGYGWHPNEPSAEFERDVVVQHAAVPQGRVAWHMAVGVDDWNAR